MEESCGSRVSRARGENVEEHKPREHQRESKTRQWRDARRDGEELRRQAWAREDCLLGGDRRGVVIFFVSRGGQIVLRL